MNAEDFHIIKQHDGKVEIALKSGLQCYIGDLTIDQETALIRDLVKKFGEVIEVNFKR